MRNATRNRRSAVAVSNSTLRSPSKCAIELCEPRRLLSVAPGTVDTSFGRNGTVTTTITPDIEDATVVATQPDGKLVVGRLHNNVDTVTRYTATGVVDTSFGTNGSIVAPVGPGQIAVLSNGNIIVAAGGTAAEFTSTGAVATTYGTNGVATMPTGGVDQAIAPDGSVYVLGSAFTVGRLTPAGQVDATYGTNGQANLYSSGTLTINSAVITVNDEGAVYAGIGITNPATSTSPATYGWGDARLTPTGAFKSGEFTAVGDSGGGSTLITVGAIAIGADGSVYVALAGHNAETFNVVGVSPSELGNTVYTIPGVGASAMTVQPDGKVIVVGTALDYDRPDQLIARLGRAEGGGGLDTTFGTAGVVDLDLGQIGDSANAVTVGNNGDIIVAGGTQTGPVTAYTLTALVGGNGAGPGTSVVGSAVVVTGSNGPDTITVASAADGTRTVTVDGVTSTFGNLPVIVYAGGGNDTVTAQGGSDTLLGGEGNDTFYAADGGATYIDGGDGTDTATIDLTGDTTVNVESVTKSPTTTPTPTPTPTPTTTPLKAKPYDTAGGYPAVNGVANAVDGSLSTYFESSLSSGGDIAIDLNAATAVAQIAFAPRAGYAPRMQGGTFQASNSSTFATGVVTLSTIVNVPTDGALTTISTGTTTPYRYWRYVGPANGYTDIAEFQLFAGTATTPTPTATPLKAKPFDTAGGYPSINGVANAVDGSVYNYFQSTLATGGDIAIDLGTALSVSKIAFAPRAGFDDLMVGGYFQSSNSSTFATGDVAIYTVTSTPSNDALTFVPTATSAAYRYWRYVGPANSYSQIAEFELFA